MYIFKSIKDPNNRFDISDITFEIDSVDRDDIVEQFLIFLSACGYLTTDLKEGMDVE